MLASRSAIEGGGIVARPSRCAHLFDTSSRGARQVRMNSYTEKFGLNVSSFR